MLSLELVLQIFRYNSILMILVEVTLKGPVDPKNGMVMNLAVLCIKMKVSEFYSTSTFIHSQSFC